jgi:predicted PurR-regulated permease PerM
MLGWRISLWAALVVAALAFLYLVRSILAPFMVALVIAVLLEPTVTKLRLRGYTRTRAILLVFGAFLLVLVAAGIWLAPVASRQVAAFSTRVEGYSEQLTAENPNDNFFVRWNPVVQVEGSTNRSFVDRFLADNAATFERLGLPSDRREIVRQYIEPQQAQLAATLQGFFSGFVGIVSAVSSQVLLMLFTPLFAFLILVDLDRLKQRSAGWIPPTIRADTLQMLGDIGHVFVKYLRGVTIVVIWYVAIAAALLTGLGAPYSLLLAMLFALLYLIPYVGPVMNAGLLLVITGLSGRTGNMLFEMGNPWGFALAITGIYFVVMLAFDPLVYTRVVGDSVGLRPIVSFFVVFAGAALFGALGMLIAFPVAGSIKVILDRLIRVTSDGEGTLDLPARPRRHRPAIEA